MDTSRPSATSPDALLSVTSSDVDPAVAAFLAEVRAEYRAPLPNDVVTDHLRMILAEAAVAPTAPAFRDRWARRARRIAAVGAVKIALTATAAAAATGTGLAATNNLPAPAQAVVADAAGLVGITIPTPATPGDPADGPGIGEGGVPALLDAENEVLLPGKAGDAPGLNKDDDGRPVTPEQAPAADERGNAGGETRGEDRAEERPAPPAPATEGSARTEDTPAADRPEAPATRPAPPQSEAAGEAEAGDAGAPAGNPPVERPDGAGNGRTDGDG